MVSAPTQKDCVDILSILRAVALICVFGLHGIINIQQYAHIRFPFFLFTPAWAAMWILFSLSGFLIGKRFFDGKCDSWAQIKQFYISRFIRIGIPYYIYLLFGFLFIDPVSFVALDSTQLLRLLTFTFDGSAGNTITGLTWFISVIMQLYLIAPLLYRYVFKKIPARSMWVAMTGLLLTGFTARYLLLFNGADWYTWVYSFAPMQLDLFFVPFMLNAYNKQLPTVIPPKLCRPLRTFLLFMFVFALLECTYFTAYHEHRILYLYTGPTFFTVLFIGLAIAFASNRRVAPKPVNLHPRFILHHPWHLLEAFSVVTFGFFLHHSLILNVLPKILQAYPVVHSACLYNWITFGGGFILSTLWATIFYLSIEKPLHQLSHRILQPPKGK